MHDITIPCALQELQLWLLTVLARSQAIDRHRPALLAVLLLCTIPYSTIIGAQKVYVLIYYYIIDGNKLQRAMSISKQVL
jgi:hypothetical protein